MMANAIRKEGQYFIAAGKLDARLILRVPTMVWLIVTQVVVPKIFFVKTLSTAGDGMADPLMETDLLFGEMRIRRLNFVSRITGMPLD
jgi:hypothetical protein